MSQTCQQETFDVINIDRSAASVVRDHAERCTFHAFERNGTAVLRRKDRLVEARRSSAINENRDLAVREHLDRLAS
jgi:hypothetical protein